MAKNTWTGRVDLSGVYTPGRHWIGFWKSFQEFPSRLETIEFSDEPVEEDAKDMKPLACRDRDGKQIFLDVSVQYQLLPERLPQLYRDYLLLYEAYIVADLRAELLLVGNSFRAEEFWTDIAKIINIFKERCDMVMERRHVKCWGLQLWGMRLAPKFEAKVVLTQVMKQRRNTAKVNLNAVAVRSQTKVVVSELRKGVTITLARGDAEVYRNVEYAKSVALVRVISTEASILDSVNSTFNACRGCSGLTGQQMVVYQWRVLLGILSGSGNTSATGHRQASIIYDGKNAHKRQVETLRLGELSGRSFAGRSQSQTRKLGDKEEGFRPPSKNEKVHLARKTATAVSSGITRPPAHKAQHASRSSLLDMDALDQEKLETSSLARQEALLWRTMPAAMVPLKAPARPLHSSPTDSPVSLLPIEKTRATLLARQRLTMETGAETVGSEVDGVVHEL